MKVLLSVALMIFVLSVCVLFVGCGDDDDDSEDSPSDDDDTDDDADDDVDDDMAASSTTTITTTSTTSTTTTISDSSTTTHEPTTTTTSSTTTTSTTISTTTTSTSIQPTTTTTTTGPTTTSTTTTTLPPIICYRDEDYDGYGNPDISDEYENGICPFGWASDNTDCDDTDILVHPGAPELPDDGIVQDCVGEELELGDATGVFVAKTGDDANPGAMASPKLTINAGATLALQSGKVVFIAEGTYTEDVKTQVSLFGGYESAGWTRDTETNITTINAENSTAVWIIESNPGRDDEGDSERDEAEANDSSPVAIQGMTVTYGRFGTFSYGVRIDGGKKTVLVKNDIDSSLSGDDFIHSISEDHFSFAVRSFGTLIMINNDINGASVDQNYGLYNDQNGTATLVGNLINGGSGGHSCGVYNANAAVTLINNDIDGGSGFYSSHGVYNIGTTMIANNDINGGSGDDSYGVSNSNGTAWLANNIVDGGTGSSDSFGFCNSATAVLTNNVINGGSGGGDSSGVFTTNLFGRPGIVVLTNNIISGGSGSGNSYGINNFGVVTLANNDIWGADMDCMIFHSGGEANTIVEVNACAWTGCAEASGNISDDPLFDVDGYHLTDSSPCINTGIDPVPDYIGAGFVDLDFEGDARPYGAGWDIGVDEWTP